ncbi:MAG: hypothetical protein JXB62_05900 [Pirellulales bacterium]|nr:hypothetical protein [Pirellulales bacterium]
MSPMDGKRRLLLLLVLVGLFGLSGAHCPNTLRQYTAPEPRALPPSPTLEQVIQVVNDNNSQIQTFSTTHATLSVAGFPSLRADIAFQRPKSFRLRGDTAVTGPELDVGSNEQLFWFWIRRNQPPAVFYCPHDQFAGSAAREMVPIEPELLVEALGTTELDPALPYHGPEILPNDRLKLSSIRETVNGPMTKVMILDGARGWILEQHVYDAEGRNIASSTASGHHRDPLTNLVMPTSVEITCPTTDPPFSMRIHLGNVQINRLANSQGQLWTMPSYPGSPWVDLSDPKIRRPSAISPPAVSRVPGRRPRLW